MKSLYEQLKKTKFLFDSHCHLNDVTFDTDRDFLVQKSIKDEVNEIWDIGINLNSSKKAINNAHKYKNVKAFVGIDPEVFIPRSEMFVGFDKKEAWFEEQFNILNKLITDNRQQTAGIGETGLDHYWTKAEGIDAETRENSHKAQDELFRLHLELAQKLDLPLTIHSRGAEKECLEIIKKYNCLGIFHSYTGDYETAKKILDAGWGLGVNGIVTFKNADELRNVYKRILGRVSNSELKASNLYQKGIYFETDAPFLSPEGKRGERNEPANVRIVFDKFLEVLKS